MFNTLEKYIFRQFFNVFVVCLLIFSAVFIVFEFFERVDNFIKEGATILQVISYMLYKIPFILQVMSPVAVLIAVLLSVGKLTQLSEVTAMRACGASMFSIIKPLLVGGTIIWLGVFLGGETIVPWSSDRLQQLYYLDIRKKAESGAYSRSNFWFRNDNRFFKVDYYDSRFAILRDLAILEVNESFDLTRLTEAKQASWGRPEIGWVMEDITERTIPTSGAVEQSFLKKAPLVIGELPEDFYNYKRRPEAMSFLELSEYTEKLESEGIPVTPQKVDLASKISFPIVNLIVVLTAFPFALFPARSGTMTASLIAGLGLGFGYHVLHAFSCSLGAAGILPVTISAWTANIIYTLIGLFFLFGSEYD
jgi:lipopolysaccharide export system permease protein